MTKFVFLISWLSHLPFSSIFCHQVISPVTFSRPKCCCPFLTAFAVPKTVLTLRLIFPLHLTTSSLAPASLPLNKPLLNPSCINCINGGDTSTAHHIVAPSNIVINRSKNIRSGGSNTYPGPVIKYWK